MFHCNEPVPQHCDGLSERAFLSSGSSSRRLKTHKLRLNIHSSFTLGMMVNVNGGLSQYLLLGLTSKPSTVNPVLTPRLAPAFLKPLLLKRISL